jgi:hypothetical protein
MLPEQAFIKVGGQIKPQGGGGSAPTSTTVQNTNIPEYAKPYVESTLGKAAAVTDINQNPYQPYQGQQVAQFTPMQNQAFQNVGNQQIAPQLTDASNIAYQTGQYGLGTQGTAAQLQNASLGYGAMAAGAGNQYARQATNPAASQAYMNPYLQASLQPALQEVQRQYDITGTQQMGNASRSNAFGGSREALMAAENQRNKNLAMNQMIGQGYNTAFDKAQQSQQFGATLGLQGLQAGQQGVAGAVNAGQYGLQGLGQAGASASTLGQLGQTQFGQEQAANQAMLSAGTQQQGLQQKGLDTAYQQYQAQLNYPYQQIGFMSDLLRGLPLTQQSTSMYQNPSMISQAAGLGTAGIGAYGMYNMATKAGGGQIKEKRMANGGITQLFDVGGSIKSDLSRMSPEELQAYIGESSSPTAKRMAQQLLAEKTALARQPQNPGVTQLPSNLPTGEAMAGGGIIAFAEGDKVEGGDSSSDSSSGSSGDTRADADAYLRRLLAGGDENIQPIPGSEMAQAAPTNDANPVALPVAAPAPITGAPLPPQNAGVTSLIAQPPTRLPAAGIEPPAVVAKTPAAVATNEKSVYGNMPLMSPEAKEAFSQYAGMYKDMRGDNKKAREEAKWMAIMQAGLGIAGGTSPNALANISQGAQPAIAQFQSAIKDIRKDDREAVKGLIDLGLTKEKFKQEVEKMGLDWHKSERVYDAHVLSANATIKAAQIRSASEKAVKPTDQTNAVDEYVAAARLDPANKGKSDEQLRVEGRIQYLVYSRPQQPNASIANAITGREKEDGILFGLETDRWKNISNPAKVKEIDAKIAERKEFLAGKVTGQSSAGRGSDAEVPGVPNASAEASAAAKWAKVPVPPVPKEVPISADKWGMAVGKLRLDPSPTNRQYFDKQFGEGASDKALKR